MHALRYHINWQRLPCRYNDTYKYCFLTRPSESITCGKNMVNMHLDQVAIPIHVFDKIEVTIIFIVTCTNFNKTYLSCYNLRKVF